MAKHTRKNATTGRSQGGPYNSKTGQVAKKKTSGTVTRSPTSRQKSTDSTSRIPTHLSMQGNASQTPPATSQKRKTTEPALQRTGKRQKTCPLMYTTEDISTIVRAVRDALPGPNETHEDIQDTEGSVSTGSDEFGTLLLFYCVCMHNNHILHLSLSLPSSYAVCNNHLMLPTIATYPTCLQ